MTLAEAPIHVGILIVNCIITLIGVILAFWVVMKSKGDYRTFRFFSFLALLQVWILGVDLLLGKGFTSAGIFNVIALVLFVMLALASQPKVHSVGTGVGWLLFIIVIAVRALGLLS